MTIRTRIFRRYESGCMSCALGRCHIYHVSGCTCTCNPSLTVTVAAPSGLSTPPGRTACHLPVGTPGRAAAIGASEGPSTVSSPGATGPTPDQRGRNPQ